MNNLKYILIDNIYLKYTKNDLFSLFNINITINANKKIGLLGPNGAGKTSLISLITSLNQPSSGEINFIDDNNNQINNKTIKQHIGFVPQDFSFYEELTPIQNLMFFGKLYNLSKDEIKMRAEFLLKELELDIVMNNKIKSFSGGMKRRVNLAIGLIHNPQIIILDEPTVGVDVQSRFKIIELLNKLNSQGATIIYTSHLMNEAQNFCDEFILIDHGKILEQLDKNQLLLKYNSFKSLEEIFIFLTGNKIRN